MNRDMLSVTPSGTSTGPSQSVEENIPGSSSATLHGPVAGPSRCVEENISRTTSGKI